ncbi:hypothetical protein GLYMA_03G057866v4 [Glycine max]|nr:hypothetical protein GLYMA_03G057866v4 [Glycine max]KAH1068726.1 hypothetical protein GYH30_006342 [Glycine max]
MLKMSRCAPKPEENTQMRLSKSYGFLIRSRWTFVGCCKRAWYKVANFEKSDPCVVMDPPH